MNYRHAFHAGNHADVVKHAALLAILDRLRAKATPFAVLDTHAGRGQYDLAGEEAARSPEWRGGIGKLWAKPPESELLRSYLARIRAFNSDGALRRYPGSPSLIADALRPGDRLIACETHPMEAAALRSVLGKRAEVQLHERDGWEAMRALLPFPERRGLVLIDPPYEAPDEMAKAVEALKGALKRFAHGVYLWWRPLKNPALLAAADAEISHQAFRADLMIDAPEREGPLTGSSLLVLNPPYGLSDSLRVALPELAGALGAGPGAGWRLVLEH